MGTHNSLLTDNREWVSRPPGMLEPSSWALLAAEILVITFIAEAMYRWWLTSRGKRGIPYRTPLPVFGNSFWFARARDLTQLHHVIRQYMPDRSISGVWVFNKLLVMVNDPNYVEELLTKRGCSTYKPEELYGIFAPLSAGIFSRNGDKWAKLREPLNKLMNSKNREDWMRVFIRRAKELSETLATKKISTNLHRHISDCTLGVLCETIIGENNEEDLQEITSSKFVDNMQSVIDLLFMRTVEWVHRIGVLYRWTYKCKSLQLMVEEPKLLIDKMIHRRLDRLENVPELGNITCYTDVVLQAAKEECLNRNDLSSLAIDMFVAGSDTTSVTVMSAILFLAMHADQQKRAHEELDNIFGDSDRDTVVEDLAKMEFLDMVLYETLRLVGVPGVARKLERTTELDGYCLPKDTIVFFRFMNLCRDRSWWAKPEQFYPEHFAKDVVNQRPKGVFTPFGRGARSCPGQLHAMTQTKVILSTLLRRFQFSTHLRYNELRYKYGFMLLPERTDVSVRPRFSK